MTTALILFEKHQNYLKTLAYRMLGSVADAEDIVQETWLKCHGIDFSEIISPKAYLTQITSRLCLDYMKSARVRREKYVGVWLPEPQIEFTEPANAGDPYKHIETEQEVSFALLLTLEQLQPAERAVFLLHDIFDFSFEDIGTILDRSNASCRKLASRARHKIRENRIETCDDKPERKQLTVTFLEAVKTGDLQELIRHLAKDAVMKIDGGGVKTAVIKPIFGSEKIHRFFIGIMTKNPAPKPDDIQLVYVNGSAGILIKEVDESLQLWQIEWSRTGELIGLNIIRNPEKMRHIILQSG